MARNRIRLPWGHGPPAPEADAPFLEHEPRRGLRPDSPEVSVFSPEQEAESHRRWRHTVLRERLSGPVTEAERLGLGLSAAALAALAAAERQVEADGEAASHGNDDPEGAGDVFAALKSAALGQGASKPPVTAKPAGATHASLDTREDNAFSNPVSSKTDNGLGVRRVTARGSGAPLESRAGGAERAEVSVLRKVEQTSGEARVPLPSEGASAAVVRGALGAEVITVAIAAMASDLPEAREDRHQADTKGANAAAAKANQGQAPVEAPSGQAEAKDAPAAAEARAEQRQGPAVGREKAGDAPAAAVQAKATADQGRGATEAPGRTKANDGDAVDAAVVAEAGADRKAGAAAEAPVEAKAKAIASAVEAESGLGHKPAKVLAQAKAAEVEVLEVKTTNPDRGAAEVTGPAKTQDALPVLETKADATRHTAEVHEQAIAKNTPAIVAADADQGHGSASAESSGQAKGAPTGTAAGASAPAAKAAYGAPAGANAEAALQQANTKDVGGAATKTELSHDAVATPGQTKDAAAPTPATKTDPGSGHAQAPGQAKATDIPVVADTKAGEALGASAGTPANQPEAKDASVVGPKSDLVQAPAEPPGGPAKPKDVSVLADAKSDPGHGQPEATTPAKATDVPSVAAGPKGGQDLDGHAEAPPVQAKPKDAPAPVETKSGLGDAPAAAPGQAEPKKAPAVPGAASDLDHRPAEPPGHAKQADPPAEAHKSAQHGGDPADAKVPTALPVAEKLNFHVADLWTGGEDQSEHGQSHTPSTGKAASPTLHAAAPDLVGATNGEHSEVAALPAEGGSPGDGTVVLFPLGSGEKGAGTGTLGQAAPESVSGKGNASSPAHKAADADPVGAKEQGLAKGGQDHAAATGPSAPLPGDATDGVVPVTPAGKEKATDQALTQHEALALLSVAGPDDAATHQNGRAVGKGSVLEYPDLHTPAPDGAAHHSGAHDQVFF